MTLIKELLTINEKADPKILAELIAKYEKMVEKYPKELRYKQQLEQLKRQLAA